MPAPWQGASRRLEGIETRTSALAPSAIAALFPRPSYADTPGVPAFPAWRRVAISLSCLPMSSKTPSPTPRSRREVLKYGAGFGLALAWPNSRVLGANDDLRIVVQGVKGRGDAHLSEFSKMKGVRVVSVCDVDPSVLDAKTTAMSQKQGFKVEPVIDIRKALESKDVDILAAATPNHWHSLAAVWASQAGKDSYIEKPISHNVWEGGQVVKAARKYNVICAGGTQSRSIVAIQEAVDFIRSGGLGKIKYVKGLCYKPRQSIGKGGNGKVPDGLDYDLWSGPKEIENPLRRQKFHYDWHWFYAYGNGDMGNQGIHQMDVARWFLGVDALAPRVLSLGGRLGYDDDGETPNTQIVYHDYPDAPLIFETRGLPKDKASQESGWGAGMNSPEEFPGESGISVVVACENGFIYANAGGKVIALDKDRKPVREFKGGGNHFENFIKAVRSRNHKDLNADCHETHLSSALCHTGLVSHQVGQAVGHQEILERIKGDSLLSERYAAMADHLQKNEVDLASSKVTLGAYLKLNTTTNRFDGNEGLDAQANALARPPYREPYVIRDEV